MMKTLYDLLGALPKDSAEDLRTAFRRAVKGAHPDLHPGDPDAALKFREIVRAQEILGDAEQRATYDHLLDLAHLEQATASGNAAAIRIHKLASGVIALAAASAVTVGGYMLFMHLPEATVVPANRPAMHASASIRPAPPPVATGKGASIVKDESAVIAGGTGAPDTAIARTDAGNFPAANADPAAEFAIGETKPSRARGASAHRNGNPNAIPVLNQASLPDPRLSPASNERGISFSRLRKFDRAFADLAPTQGSENPGRAKAKATPAGMPRLNRAAIPRPMLPVPRRRPVTQDPSREESVASVRLR